jgi:hypothetical protein
MCTTSNHLKLCTCATYLDLNSTDHWVLKQAETEYASAVRGSSVIPNDTVISASEDKANVEKLTILLNANYCFDKEMNIVNDDTLTMYFIEKGSIDKLQYTFKYKNNKWVYDKWANTPFDSRPEKGKGIIETEVI